jgi:Helix-turn-helix domain
MITSTLLNAEEAAEYLRLKPATLAKFRHVGGGPQFVKLGSRCLYPRESLDAWIRANLVVSTSDYMAAEKTGAKQ